MSAQIVGNRYRLDQHLAHINHSDFYDGYDTQTNAAVIVRLLHLAEPGFEAKLQRFMDNELALMKRLDHPNILKILDYGVEGSLYHLVHEQVPFRTLAQYIQANGKLNLQAAVRHGLELSDILSYLHHIKIIHCDLKPENVLAFDGTIKLIEFSISNHTLDGSYVTGTPPYMSPESILRESPAVARDVWALGITLFEMLTGKPPYILPDDQMTPENMPQLFRMILHDPVPEISQLVPGLPPRLIALINWMLEKDPAKRIGSMRQIAAELEAILTALQQDSAGFSTGSIIGERYRLQTPIAEGGFGLVFRAADLQTGQTVAIKQLKSNLAGDSQQLARFEREANVLHQLNHPGIVRVLETIKTEGSHYLILEYIAGGDLRSRLRAQPLTMREAVKIALEVADALARAHHLNIIHRDMKPENVLLAADGTARITDFGLAQIESGERLTESGALIGTIAYIAPEILQGKEASRQSDMWAFGVMLYEMLTGKIPFKGEFMAQVVNAILNDPIPPVTDCPESLANLVESMLQHDPNQRLSSMREVATRLEQILANSG